MSEPIEYTITITEWERLQICLGITREICELEGDEDWEDTILALRDLRKRLRDMKNRS